jgi:hypothetical protein
MIRMDVLHGHGWSQGGAQTKRWLMVGSMAEPDYEDLR